MQQQHDVTKKLLVKLQARHIFKGIKVGGQRNPIQRHSLKVSPHPYPPLFCPPVLNTPEASCYSILLRLGITVPLPYLYVASIEACVCTAWRWSDAQPGFAHLGKLSFP